MQNLFLFSVFAGLPCNCQVCHDDLSLIQKAQHRSRSLREQALYSDEGQDVWVLANLGSSTPTQRRTFLDIGARDGDFFSNTRKLEEQGWTGICIEPLPTNFRKFHRTCKMVKAALVPKNDPKMMYSDCEDGSGITGHSGFSATNKNPGSVSCTQKSMPQVTFGELGLPKVLDYVSLDVEGFEMHILKAFPFGTHCAKLWTIEGAGTSYPSSVSEPIVSLLEKHGCQRESMTNSDGFFTCTCG